MAAKFGPLLTLADLDACPDDDGNRYELIDGELFVSRSPGIPHQRVLLNLEVEFANYLKLSPIGILVPGTGTIFSNYDAVIPDIVFIRHERWEKVTTEQRVVGAPDIVVEILSPGAENRRRDLSVKRKLYAKYGVEEYWIVDKENQSVVIFRLHDQLLEEVATQRFEDSITSPLLPGFELKVKTIFTL